MTHRISYIFLLAIASFVLWSCVDVNKANIPSTKDYRSLARFVHVAADTLGSAAVAMDGAVVGNVAFGQATAYLDVPAGSRSLRFVSTTTSVTFNTDEQATVLIHDLSDGERYLYLPEGYFFTDYGIPGVALVRFVNIAKGSAQNISFRDGSATGSNLSTNVAFVSAPPYTQVSSGGHTVYVVSIGGYTATITKDQEVPPTNDPSTGTATVTLSADNGFVYSILVTSYNSQGFYTGAHFHNAPEGSIVFAGLSDVVRANQKVTFAASTRPLSGDQEVPPVTTSARGTGTFVLYRDSLVFTISVTADTVDSIFTMAHFHNAATGSVGPVVRTIIPPSTFKDTTVSGTWKRTDAEPLTDALIDEALAGRIYVNFHSILNPAGAIRTQLIPDSITTNVYAGAWNDASLTDSLKRAIVLGNIYVNFHTTVNLGGAIRGQLTVDPAKGHYGVASLSSSDTTFSAGRIYTVVTTGSGTNLQLLRFSNRQFGISKPVPSGEQNQQINRSSPSQQ